ncbi:MAG: hypothetical protein DI589_21535 [Shinella sp.]|nr:MAG: hypothetical protein DI589_21535 [Shinella sp.]
MAMRFITLAAMFIACLVYGFMPAQASASMHAPVTVSDVHAGHHGMEMGQTHTHTRPYSDPCPHRGGPVHGSFCAACLAIVPQPDLARDGRPPFSWPRPDAGRELVAEAPAPADPPPRA